eukprot:m.385405 g.385405  ORF g.385405 m.385405 type:complete len:757 (+) comp28275_c2_seq7:40-2310(+)
MPGLPYTSTDHIREQRPHGAWRPVGAGAGAQWPQSRPHKLRATKHSQADLDAARNNNSAAFATHLCGIMVIGMGMLIFGSFILMPRLEDRAQVVWGAKLPHSAQVPGVRVDEGAVEGAVQRDVSVERIAREARDEPRPPSPQQPREPRHETGKRWREDGRCGPRFPALGAPDFGECDPMADANEKGPCCNPKSGWCGNIRGKSWGHCPTACKVCVDFGPKGEGLSRRAVGTADDPQREGNRRAAPKASNIHEWASSNLNATPPDGARLHQSIGTEGMDERMADEDPENARRRRFVKSMMVSAWRGYESHAWGENELNPKAKTGHSASVFGKTKMGATIVDALDTMMIMNMTDEVARAREWIENDLHFTGSTYVSVFEVTIRFVGGLLSAFAISGDPLYRDKAYAIARKLLPAFATPTGIPMAQVNLDTGQIKNWGWASGKASVLSEFGTMQMEFEYLSLVTGDNRFKDMINFVINKVIQSRPPDGLYPNFLNPKTGRWGSKHVSLGALGDSFYEYLLKMWVYHGGRNNIGIEVDMLGRRAFDDAMVTVQSKLMRTSKSGHLHLVDMRASRIIPKMGHLACFTGGMYALASKGAPSAVAAEYMANARGITDTCRAAYNVSKAGVGPEVMHFTDKIELSALKRNERYYILRPETVESYFYMWRLTKEQKYRDWAWDAVQAIETNCRCGDDGYCGLKDVNADELKQDDVQQSFFLAETLKYLYLIFCDDDVISLDLWVLNTEAHPLPIQNFRKGRSDTV